MTENRIEAIALAFCLFLVIATLFASFHTITECRAAGGTVVRGMFWFECIQ